VGLGELKKKKKKKENVGYKSVPWGLVGMNFWAV
jgi:hypothetical protein